MKAHPKSPCSGKYGLSLDVLLTSKCNGRCSFCIEDKGFHPEESVGPELLAKICNEHPAENILLLGGEPTLYPHLDRFLHHLNKKSFLTTNGSRLTPNFLRQVPNLKKLSGLNLSRHSSDPVVNSRILNINQMPSDGEIIETLQELSVPTRLNCNLTKEGVKNYTEAHKLLMWAKQAGTFYRVRFAELSQRPSQWLSAVDVFPEISEIKNDPWECGCEDNLVIEDMPVTIRRVCAYTGSIPQEKKSLFLACHESKPKPSPSCHKPPSNPCGSISTVLYYNGTLSKGWKTA